MTVSASIDLALPPDEARAVVLDELASAGIALPDDDRAEFDWRPAEWSDAATRVELRFEPSRDGTRFTATVHGWEALVDGDAQELAGWFATRLLAPLLGGGYGDWLTDRRARRPSGGAARATYRDPVYHRPGFRALLELLELGPDDVLLEVGCGGGALLEEALRTGCRAFAVDHSADMIRVATELNREAVETGRLQILPATADRLPFADRTATAAVMTGVLGFLPDPVAALGEMRRVLVDGGRLALGGSDPELRGTPAAPEPMASRLSFYDDPELERLALDAGFRDVDVHHPDLEPHARAAGVPHEHVSLFGGRTARFLTARR